MTSINSSNRIPLTQTEGYLRKVVLWLRWPPIMLTSGVSTIWVAIFGAPTASALSLVMMAVLVWGQVGGLIDIIPRVARWFAWFHQRLVDRLAEWCQWQTRKINQIDRIWSEPWDE
jgi:hypothetical protein